jgi:zinc/manganese transport system permease protein
MVGPPAAAQRLTTGLWSGLVLAAMLAVGEAWLGLTLAFYSDWPVSFCIALLSGIGYFAALLFSALRAGPAVLEHAHD